MTGVLLPWSKITKLDDSCSPILAKSETREQQISAEVLKKREKDKQDK